jgi:hypothetical protein
VVIESRQVHSHFLDARRHSSFQSISVQNGKKKTCEEGKKTKYITESTYLSPLTIVGSLLSWLALQQRHFSHHCRRRDSCDCIVTARFCKRAPAHLEPIQIWKRRPLLFYLHFCICSFTSNGSLTFSSLVSQRSLQRTDVRTFSPSNAPP